MKKPPGKPERSNQLRLRAENRLLEHPVKALRKDSHADARRLVQELQIHQIELEMQNEELKQTKAEVDAGLEKFTELYDFAPVGYFTLTTDGAIQQVNLTGACLVGMERTRLVGVRLGLLLASNLRHGFEAFLKQVFVSEVKQSGDFELLQQNQSPLIVNIEAKRQLDGRVCHAVLVDITERKRAEETQRRFEVLAASNAKLISEIIHRQAVEKALTASEQQARLLLDQSRELQKQLRLVSHQSLLALENQRKEISHELHDKISQILIGINVRLAVFIRETGVKSRSVAPLRRLVEQSVRIVHQYSTDLRPMMLDDLGLIPALRAYIKDFPGRKGRKILFSAFSEVEALDNVKRTMLYRVAQEALINVAKHADASVVKVSITKTREGVCLAISDNGKGFETGRIASAQWESRHGVIGMRERVEMGGGRFTIESVPGAGTAIKVVVPSGKPKKEKKPTTDGIRKAGKQEK